MSDSQGPWSVRGISKEDREKAVKAAERRNIPVGEWLAAAINAALREEREPRAAPMPADIQPHYAPSDTAPTPTANPYQEAMQLAALLPLVGTTSTRSDVERAIRKAVLEEVARVRMTRRSASYDALPAPGD